MLHILFNSPFNIDVYLMNKMISREDSLVAIQDGVLISINNNFILSYLSNKLKKLYVLKEDVIARGISKFVSCRFKLINYSEFIILTQYFDKYLNW